MQPNFRVLHLSTSDVTGGAARCAYRLHRGLRRLGHDSRMLVSRRRSDDPAVLRFERPAGARAALRAALRRAWIGRARAPMRAALAADAELFSDHRSVLGPWIPRRVAGNDIVHLHWVADFVDYASFFRTVPAVAPIVWTLHDMNPITGGCHYDHDCGRFRAHCGACPQLGSAYPLDASREVWRGKHAALSRVPAGRLHLVTPSRWLAGEVERSSLFGGRFPVAVIPYGVCTDTFAPRDSAAARDALGIPRGAKVVLFGANAMSDGRKGFATLARAIDRLSALPGLHLLTAGKGRAATLPIPHTHLGHIDDDRLLSLVYSAADAFVAPSTQDNLPAAVLEALACGVPVVAFRVGGVPEAVRPGHTGDLAAAHDADDLARCLERLLQDDGRRRELAANARRVAVEEYGLEQQAQRYVALYRSAVSLPETAVRSEAVPDLRPSTPTRV